MLKILAALCVGTAFFAGGLMAGLGDAPSTVQEGNIDVNKPSFLTILLKKPDIYDDIPEEKDITIFAPSDAAFAKLNPEVLDNLLKHGNEEQLKRVMDSHVVVGEYTTKELEDGMTLTSHEGNELKITKENGKVFVNGSEVIEPDGIIRRGTMHVIDRVLIPQDLTMQDLKK